MRTEDWEELYSTCKSQLEKTNGKSFKGYFYMGISFYKIEDYDNAIRAFAKAEYINPDDAQL